MELIANFFAYTPGSHFLFTSLEFWIFLTLVLGGFSLCYKNRQARNNFLFFCSLFFYYKVGGYFIFILLLSILFNFGIGIQIENSSQRKRSFWTAIGIAANLALLAVFKYNVFFTRLWNTLLGLQLPEIDYFDSSFCNLYASSFQEPFSFSERFPGLDRMIPPIGLSFFTFQAISYLVDIKRGHIAASKNLGDFGFYLSFFPQLVAGPIVRAGQFLPQLPKHYMLSSTEFSAALGMILVGLIKKMLFADYLSLHFAGPVFDHPELFTGFENWMAMYAFAIRIYFDFSGYTDIAIGIAALFGFQLPINFRSPYKASSLTDFWHRWHISLSTWFRDYLYIPLGGNRHGKIRMTAALLLTMLAAGFWHGAGFGFLLWGGLHGLALCTEKLVRWDRWVRKNRFSQVIGWIVTFHLVCFGWIFFRADSLQTASDMFFMMFGSFSWQTIPAIVAHYALPFTYMGVALIFILLVKERQKKTLARLFCNLPIWSKFACVIAVALLLIISRHTEPQAFIYFQF